MANVSLAADQHIHFDGACRDNGFAGAVGGYGWTVPGRPELNNAAPLPPNEEQTNNRAELRGASAALRCGTQQFPSRPVVIVGDAEYVIKGMNEWRERWLANGWVAASGEPVKNRDLWVELIAAEAAHVATGGAVRFLHVPRSQNEVANILAGRGAMGMPARGASPPPLPREAPLLGFKKARKAAAKAAAKKAGKKVADVTEAKVDAAAAVRAANRAIKKARRAAKKAAAKKAGEKVDIKAAAKKAGKNVAKKAAKKAAKAAKRAAKKAKKAAAKKAGKKVAREAAAKKDAKKAKRVAKKAPNKAARKAAKKAKKHAAKALKAGKQAAQNGIWT